MQVLKVILSMNIFHLDANFYCYITDIWEIHLLTLEMALPTRWVWAKSRSWWWTGKPGMLQSMGSKRIRHDWATEVNWTDLLWHDVYWKFCLFSNWICSYCWTFRSSLYILHASTLSTITWKYFFPVCSLPFLLSDYNYVHSKRLRIW